MTQLETVKKELQEREWVSPFALSSRTGYSERSIASRIRELRTLRYGALRITTRRDPDNRQMFQYKLEQSETQASV